MITKLRKAQDSWVAKSILVLTALSFMSLFGISGYINGAAGNRAVIKVNDRTVSQLDVRKSEPRRNCSATLKLPTKSAIRCWPDWCSGT